MRWADTLDAALPWWPGMPSCAPLLADLPLACLADAGVTTILVTHDQSEALSFADQLAVMREGQLVRAVAAVQWLAG